MTTRTVDVHDAQIQLADLLSIVEQGVEIILTDGTTPLARLVPLHTSTAARVPGLHAHLGTAWVSDDFDESLQDEFWIETDETAAG